MRKETYTVLSVFFMERVELTLKPSAPWTGRTASLPEASSSWPRKAS